MCESFDGVNGEDVLRQPLRNKVVVISGSSRGVGRELASLLLLRGAKVVINGIDQERLASAYKSLCDISSECMMVTGDISSWEFCVELMSAAVKRFGGIDFLVNNAAIANRGTLENVISDVLERMTTINVLGSIYPTKAALPHLKRSRGYALFVSSVVSFHGFPFNSMYCATKSALTAFEQSFNLEYKSEGVGSGVVYFGFIENDATKTIYESDGTRIYLGARNGVRTISQRRIGMIMAKILEKRTRHRVVGATGRLLRLLSNVAPRLVDLYLYRKRAAIQTQSEGPAMRADY